MRYLLVFIFLIAFVPRAEAALGFEMTLDEPFVVNNSHAVTKLTGVLKEQPSPQERWQSTRKTTLALACGLALVGHRAGGEAGGALGILSAAILGGLQHYLDTPRVFAMPVLSPLENGDHLLLDRSFLALDSEFLPEPDPDHPPILERPSRVLQIQQLLRRKRLYIAGSLQPCEQPTLLLSGSAGHKPLVQHVLGLRGKERRIVGHVAVLGIRAAKLRDESTGWEYSLDQIE